MDVLAHDRPVDRKGMPVRERSRADPDGDTGVTRSLVTSTANLYDS